MATFRITEAELARDLAGVLARVRQGAEVIVERNHHPIAVIRPPILTGRPVSECIALAEAHASTATPDAGFMHDVEEGIRSRSRPWHPPSWE